MRHGVPFRADADTLWVGWNRYGSGADVADAVERAGGKVLIAENGYVGVGGVSPHSMAQRDPYALAPRFHNDSAMVRVGEGDRWARLGVDLKPWRERTTTGHILICPNRSFGTPGRVMPSTWAADTKRHLEAIQSRPVRIRAHPGNNAPVKPLAEDLAGCHAVVVWSSSAGVHALIAGVPVVAEAPAWICKEATIDLAALETGALPDRLPALRRLAWAQWSVAEIASGEAFRHLL